MHEVSLVRSLLTQVERIVAGQGGGKVRVIRLKCGSMSGIEPALVLSAFDALREESNCGDASLSIEEVPLEVGCLECAARFVVQQFRFTCPHCSSENTEVIQGDSLVFESVELEPLADGGPR